MQIQEGWKALQQKNTDLIGIGNKIHQKHPELPRFLRYKN
ncbi:hypothetical protein [Paenibacillus sp. 8b26]